MSLTADNLPPVLAGPIVRRAINNELVFWLVTSKPFNVNISVNQEDGTSIFSGLPNQHNINHPSSTQYQLCTIPVGEFAFIQLISLTLENDLSQDQWVYYDINVFDKEQNFLCSNINNICYSGNKSPRFWYTKSTTKVLHGSCRKPHFDSPDGLVAVEHEIALHQTEVTPSTLPPSLLMMSGDQVYIDDVAGPMLTAIHQIIKRLKLHSGNWKNSDITNSQELFSSPNCYYQRDQILPIIQGDTEDLMAFFSGKKKPVFTSVSAHNHLISFAEVIAMYLLVWSPELWSFTSFSNENISAKYKERYLEEQKVITDFVSNLPAVRRALAHIPTYMIFDDHDVTDDWNLSRSWEEDAYGHPFSKRIIGNALLGYWLCQGWGNNPQEFDEVYQQARISFTRQGMIDVDSLIDQLLRFDKWHYSLNTSPKLVVLDTRTHRWRSENNAKQPSGLMDWEALIDLQQDLFDEQAVILISPAPIFGVKIIEIMQKVFTFFGQALTVDAENWMAHKGTANVILNIFQHSKTPPHFIILSGDVHYSFVYDILLRNSQNTPNITQITCSGIKNQFPKKLLGCFAFINDCLFSPSSPLNLFTKRRDMEITARKANGNKLLNQSGIGLLEISPDYQIKASVLSEDKHFIFTTEPND